MKYLISMKQLRGAAKQIGPEPRDLDHHGDLERGQMTHIHRAEIHITPLTHTGEGAKS